MSNMIDIPAATGSFTEMDALIASFEAECEELEKKLKENRARLDALKGETGNEQ